MKTLIKRLAKIFSFVIIPPRRADHFNASDAARRISDQDRWDDALTACMYDENARTYLDYIGPRGR